MTSYFTIDDFHNDFNIPTLEIRNKIQVHIDELNPIRKRGGFPIIISKRSGYRSRLYEISKGRSGKSQHCFIGEGAVDLTCAPEHLEELLSNLLNYSSYTRICYYPLQKFIHCDWGTSTRITYISANPSSAWTRTDLTTYT